MMDKKKFTFAKNILDRYRYTWYAWKIVWDKSKVEWVDNPFKNGKIRYGYQCAICKKIDKKSSRELDHIDPTSARQDIGTDLNKYVDRLFCDPRNGQILCSACHKKKTREDVRKK